MKNHCRAGLFFITVITALFFVLANIASVDAFQNNNINSIFFNQPPQNPPVRIIELLGRYENVRNVKDNFLILEDKGALKMLRSGAYYLILHKNGMKYICMKDANVDENALEFVKLPDGDNNNRAYCLLGGGFYRKIIYGGENGGVYKIKPLKPLNELKAAALSAKPPYEPDLTLECELLDLHKIGGALKFDIRYATRNNFMGECFYETPGAFLQKPAAYALLYVARSLARHGIGVIVYDAYRPWYVTKMFYDATPDGQKNFVADPAKGSRHNRGTAVDVGLYDLTTGGSIDMGSGYDEFSERASPGFAGATSYARWHRKLLERYMNKAGFKVYEDEWWHFDYKLDVVKYPLLNLAFDRIEEKR